MAGKPRPRKKPPADLVERVVEAMARKHRTTVKDIMSHSLFPEHVAARVEAMRIVWMHGRGRYSCRSIGEAFGKGESHIVKLVARWRQEIATERNAAINDMITFGTGVLQIDGAGVAKHVPLADVWPDLVGAA